MPGEEDKTEKESLTLKVIEVQLNALRVCLDELNNIESCSSEMRELRYILNGTNKELDLYQDIQARSSTSVENFIERLRVEVGKYSSLFQSINKKLLSKVASIPVSKSRWARLTPEQKSLIAVFIVLAINFPGTFCPDGVPPELAKKTQHYNADEYRDYKIDQRYQITEELDFRVMEEKKNNSFIGWSGVAGCCIALLFSPLLAPAALALYVALGAVGTLIGMGIATVIAKAERRVTPPIWSDANLKIEGLFAAIKLKNDNLREFRKSPAKMAAVTSSAAGSTQPRTLPPSSPSFMRLPFAETLKKQNKTKVEVAAADSVTSLNNSLSKTQ